MDKNSDSVKDRELDNGKKEEVGNHKSKDQILYQIHEES